MELSVLRYLNMYIIQIRQHASYILSLKKEDISFYTFLGYTITTKEVHIRIIIAFPPMQFGICFSSLVLLKLSQYLWRFRLLRNKFKKWIRLKFPVDKWGCSWCKSYFTFTGAKKGCKLCQYAEKYLWGLIMRCQNNKECPKQPGSTNICDLSNILGKDLCSGCDKIGKDKKPRRKKKRWRRRLKN